MAKIQLGEVLSLPAVVPEWPMGRNLPSPAHQCSQGFRWVALDGRSDSFHVLSTQPVASVKSESQDRTQLARCGPVLDPGTSGRYLPISVPRLLVKKVPIRGLLISRDGCHLCSSPHRLALTNKLPRRTRCPKGHLRRLSTDDLSDLCHLLGFHLSKEFYSYHYFGSIDWITTSVKTVVRITDGKTAIDSRAKRELIKQQVILLSIALLRTPAIIVPMVLRHSNRKLKHYTILILSIPLYILSLPVHLFFKWKAKAEWASNKYERTGSEMWLHFRRI